jgi:hypothetical protein
VAAEESDVGLVGHNMSELVEQLGEHLVAPPRTPSRAAGDAAAPVAETADV